MQKKIHLIESILTWQGEIFSGRRTLLLRFKDCNRVSGISKSSTKKINPCIFCDTREKLSKNKKFEISIKDIQTIVDEHGCDIIITGGEPTYGRNLSETLNIINSIRCNNIYVETNGFDLDSIVDKDVNVVFSPKIFYDWEINECLQSVKKYAYKKNFYIKLVYQDNELVNKFLSKCMTIINDKSRFYLMPEGKTLQNLTKNSEKTIEVAKKFDLNLSTRMQVVYDFV